MRSLRFGVRLEEYKTQKLNQTLIRKESSGKFLMLDAEFLCATIGLREITLRELILYRLGVVWFDK